MTLVIICIGYFYLTHSPFPDSQARPAVGEKVVIQSDSRVINGITYYLSGPEAPAKRVVLSASAGREVSDFNELVTALNAQGYRTLAVEHGGINGAPIVNAADMALLAFPLIKALENDRYMDDTDTFAFIGHAFGNRIVRAAGDYFARTEGTMRPNAIVLLAADGTDEIDPELQNRLETIFDTRATFKTRKDAIQSAFFAEGNTIPKHWTRGWHRHTAALQDRAKTNKIEEWENAGGVPLLVVQPAQDRIAPQSKAGDYLAAKFPDQVTLSVIDNAGHALLPEQPDTVAKIVIDYLATKMTQPEGTPE